jgi:hypothetical protein
LSSSAACRGETCAGSSRELASSRPVKHCCWDDTDILARPPTEKLLTYATGGAPEAADKLAIDAIVRKLKDKDYGLRTLVHEIVQSKLFQSK